MTKVRIAVAGAGVIGRAHIETIRQSATSVLAAIVDPSQVTVEIAAKAGVPHYNSLEEMLARDRPDAVILATPNRMHVEHATICLRAGLPMLLEKPIASTVAEAEALVRLAEAAQARILIGHHRAHSPIMTKAHEVVRSGVLGRIVAVMGSATFCKPDHYFTDAPWRREIGAGPILANMIHEVHSLRLLCGEIVAVQAFASRAVRGFPVEDTVAINLRFASGALGTFMLSDTAACPRSWEQTSQEDKAFPTYADEDCYVLAGTHGSLSVPTMRLKTYRNDAERSWLKPFDVQTVALIGEDPLKHQFEHFVAVVRGDAAPLVSAREGLKNLLVTEAIATAAKSGQVIQIPME